MFLLAFLKSLSQEASYTTDWFRGTVSSELFMSLLGPEPKYRVTRTYICYTPKEHTYDETGRCSGRALHTIGKTTVFFHLCVPPERILIFDWSKLYSKVALLWKISALAVSSDTNDGHYCYSDSASLELLLLVNNLFCNCTEPQHCLQPLCIY